MLERRSALKAHPTLKPGTTRGPVGHGGAAVLLAERRPLAILQVSAFAATIDDAAQRLSSALGLELPAPNRSTGDHAKSLRATGPGIWQIVAAPSLLLDAPALRNTLAGVATVVDLSHARAALQVSGGDAARTLAKHCGLDFDLRVFPTGSTTNTRFGNLGITLARLDDVPTFELLVFRGYAEFVFEALEEAATEFGVEIAASG